MRSKRFWSSLNCRVLRALDLILKAEMGLFKSRRRLLSIAFAVFISVKTMMGKLGQELKIFTDPHLNGHLVQDQVWCRLLAQPMTFLGS